MLLNWLVKLAILLVGDYGKIKIAQSKDTGPEILDFLAKHTQSWEIFENIIRNPNTSEKTALKIAKKYTISRLPSIHNDEWNFQFNSESIIVILSLVNNCRSTTAISYVLANDCRFLIKFRAKYRLIEVLNTDRILL